MAEVVVKDNGYTAVVANAGAANGAKIAVGIHSDASGEVMAKAEANEFGTDTAPARSFVGAFADEHQDEIVTMIEKQLEQAIKQGRDPLQALEAIALKIQGDMQANIAAGIEPPNAPATIARKGSSTPLIDKGELRSSIAGKVIR